MKLHSCLAPLRALLAVGLLACASAGHAAVAYGSNLVVNGDAESGTAGWQGYDPQNYNLFQSVNYGSNWVLPTQPGPADRGSKMFAGLGAYAVGYQLLDLGMETMAPIAFTLSGWLGGWAAQGDNALLFVQFLDNDGNELSSAAIGPVAPADRNNVTGLFYQEATGWLPTGTTDLAFWLSMERQGGGDNDGYADNLAFVLAAPNEVPEPVGLAFLALALVPVSLRLRRRR